LPDAHEEDPVDGVALGACGGRAGKGGGQAGFAGALKSWDGVLLNVAAVATGAEDV
jgi:hypothetical protein